MKSDPISILNLDETTESLTIQNITEECTTVILERDGKPQYVVMKWDGGDISNSEDIIKIAKRKLKRNLRVLHGLTKRKSDRLKG
ncbi:MAG: hypothetical protein LBP51_04695 [Deferribacteraceae bacterium]|jgi:hypothetical protein|nr:hypothetical protein [Deferribacteraceae bacterium]